MFNEDDLYGAVKAGAITDDAAEAFRTYLAQNRTASVTSEERFKLASGFNDFFVSIAAIILLIAIWSIGNEMMSDYHDYRSILDMNGPHGYFGRYKWLGPLLCAATAWALAEYFNRIRRMILPSIILFAALFICFAYGLAALYFDWDYSKNGQVFCWSYDFSTPNVEGARARLHHQQMCTAYHAQQNREFLAFTIIAPIVAGLSYLHWRRLRLPISIAGVIAGLAASVLFLICWMLKVSSLNSLPPLLTILVTGIVTFGYAMWWDMSDRTRDTQRSDIAFWLHLLAAPMIAHSAFMLLGVSSGSDVAVAAGVAVLAIYLFFAIVAIAVDRRALLVSALAYVLIALAALFDKFGIVQLNVALTAFAVGSALLVLSAFWNVARRRIVSALPVRLRDTLPPVPAHL
jgi:hypothetical protein